MFHRFIVFLSHLIIVWKQPFLQILMESLSLNHPYIQYHITYLIMLNSFKSQSLPFFPLFYNRYSSSYWFHSESSFTLSTRVIFPFYKYYFLFFSSLCDYFVEDPLHLLSRSVTTPLFLHMEGGGSNLLSSIRTNSWPFYSKGGGPQEIRKSSSFFPPVDSHLFSS